MLKFGSMNGGALSDADFLKELSATESLLTALETAKINVSEEGFAVDLFLDGPIVALLSLNDDKIEKLEPLIEQCLRKVEAAGEDKFGGKSGVTEFGDKGGFGVYSKYLPDQASYNGAVAALKKGAAYCLSTSPEKFQLSKFEECFKGSCYIKKGRFATDTAKGCGFWNLYEFPVQRRGWTEKKHFLDALKQARDIIAVMKKIQTHLQQIKKNKYSKEDADAAKEYLKYIKETSNLCAHLCRGITVASKMVVKGTLRRVAQKIWGEH